MIPLIVTSETLVEHCEKYLFFYSGGTCTIHADSVNIFEIGLLHQYVYIKILMEREKQKKMWFQDRIFLPTMSYMMYKELEPLKEIAITDYENAANHAIEKMLIYADYYNKGCPPDDKELGQALAFTINEGQAAAAKLIMEMIERAKREGGQNAEGKN